MEKIWLVACCTCVVIMSINKCEASHGKEYPGEFSKDDIKDIEFLEHLHIENRPKRSGYGASYGGSSGSGDILNSIKSAVAAGIKKKIGQLARGSAAASGQLAKGVVSASGAFSAGSSGGHEHGGGYAYHHDTYEHVPETYDQKSFSFWELKKSILNTLLQAIKAIKGGVIAVKGQLIKGSGYIVSAKGKLISQKGEAITNLGKNIASSAMLVPHPSSSGHAEYGPPPSPNAHYSAPSAPSDVYQGSAPEYEVPEPHHEGSDHQAGILILKKITKDHHPSPDVPSFKPVSPSGPGLGTILGKLFSASSSLDPHKPTPFGHTGSGVSTSHSLSQAHGEIKVAAPHDLAPHHSHLVAKFVPFKKQHSDGHNVAEESVGDVQKVKLTAGEKAEIEVEKPCTDTLASSEENTIKEAQPSPDVLAEFIKANPNLQIQQNSFANTQSQVAVPQPNSNPHNLGVDPSQYQTAVSALLQANPQLQLQQNPHGGVGFDSSLDFQSQTGNPQHNPSSNLGSLGFGFQPQATESQVNPYLQFQQNPFGVDSSFQSQTFLQQNPSGGAVLDSVPSYSQNIEVSRPNPNGFAQPSGFLKATQSKNPNLGLSAYSSSHSVGPPGQFAEPPGHFAEPPSGEVLLSSLKGSYKRKIRNPYYRMTKKRPSGTSTAKRRRKNPNVDVVKSISYEIGPNGPTRLT